MDPSSKKLTPRWLVITVLLVAVGGALLLGRRDLERERLYLDDLFVQKGETLINALETIIRAPSTEDWTREDLQDFILGLEKTDEVRFIAITDETGRVLALSGGANPDHNIFPAALPAINALDFKPHKQIIDLTGRDKAFMVYRPFLVISNDFYLSRMQSMGHDEVQPSDPSRGRHGQMMAARRWRNFTLCPQTGETDIIFCRSSDIAPRRYIWVGLDMAPFNQAKRAAARNSLAFIALFGLLGLAGLSALFWAHNSRTNRLLYQQSAAMTSEMISRLPLGLMVLDADGRINSVNPKTLDITGLPEYDLTGRQLAEVTFGGFPQHESLNAAEVELSFQGEGGRTVRVSLNSGPIVTPEGQYLGQVILMEDLGEIGRLKADLAKKDRLTTLGRMAAGLAHEIRNPLGAVRGLAQHLLSKAPPDQDDHEALEVILVSLDRLNSTITDFLEFAKPTELKTAPVDLANFINKLNTLMQYDAQSGQVEIDLNLPEEPLWAEADEGKLAQALLNIYLNGLQAAGRHGEGQAARLMVTLKKLSPAEALICFEDNGRGFAQEQLDRPFVPYFTTKAEGTGLGLALVEKIITAHGGRITLANSQKGGGLVSIILKTKAENGSAA